MASNETPTPGTDEATDVRLAAAARGGNTVLHLSEQVHGGRSIEDVIEDMKSGDVPMSVHVLGGGAALDDESRGEGKAMVAEALDSPLRLVMKGPVVPRVERRKAERVAARAERRGETRGE